MRDAMYEDTTTRECAIAAKLKNLTDNRVNVKGTFELDQIGTAQLRSLQQSQLEQIHPTQNLGSTFPPLGCYNIPKTGKAFLSLFRKPSKLYVRDGYMELYNAMFQAWTDTENENYRVCLIGNAGTGKSLFQLFALKQLIDMQGQEREYDIVIRQVDSVISIIDLEQVNVFTWDTKDGHVVKISEALEKTLYFFEPGNNPDRTPLGVFLPSLATLSPCEQRIKEYSKKLCTTLYFWPWSFSEMWAVVRHSQLSIDFDKFIERYKLFGGIIRNVLGEDNRAEEKLKGRLAQIDLKILTSTALNVDREDSGGNTVSGYLVCYNHRRDEGNDSFSIKNPEYTSLAVEEAVANKLRTLTVHENIDGVKRRLDGELVDLSGQMLENAAVELLSLGATYQWQSSGVGGLNWDQFHNPRKKKLIRTYTIRQNFLQSNLIIAPTKKNFPGVDFLFSRSDLSLPVVAFQCTWNDTHPLTVRALYEFRCIEMDIADTQLVNIYLISPNQEEHYQSKNKLQFLEGSLDADLQWTKNTTISADKLQTMWDHTNIHVLRPARAWKETILKWLEGKTHAT